MKKRYFRLMVCNLFLLISLCACSGDKFPTGLFEHEIIKGFIFEINKDGTWAYYANGRVVNSGTYSIKGKELIVETDKISESINPNLATYEWAYHNSILTLQLKGKNNPPECFRNLSEKTGVIDPDNWFSLDA